MDFPALWSALIDDHVVEHAERHLLAPIVAVGVLCLLYWHVYDDLRTYFRVQVKSLGTALLVVATYLNTNGGCKYLLAACSHTPWRSPGSHAQRPYD